MKSLKAMITGLFLVGCTSSVTYETISAKDAKEMMGTQDVVILDVREESEYQQGHIREAQLIPLSQIQENNQELPDKDQTVLVYCRSGSRSAKAAQKLVKLGYTHVYDFGGINDWPYEIDDLCAKRIISLLPEAEKNIEIRVNGALTGYGELVEVDDKLGVEIHSWLSGNNNVK